MTRRFAFYVVSAMVAIVGLSQGQARAGQVIKILQLNFNSEIVPFDDRHGSMRQLRYDALVDFVKRESPDVIFLEEGWNYKNHACLSVPLSEDIGYDQFYRIGEGFPFLLWDSNVVMAKKEFQMKEKRKVQLPHSAPHLGDEIHWMIPFGPITNIVGARLTLASGEPLIIYSTHLLGGAAPNVLDQVKAMDLEVRKHATGYDHVPWDQAKVIIAGDMNSDPSMPAMQYLRDSGYTDTWAVAHADHVNDNVASTNCGDPYAPRFNPLTIGARQLPDQSEIDPDNRIDYIYTRGPHMRVLASTQVFTHPVNGFWMSDHYGVMTTLAIDDDAAPAVPNPLTDSDEERVAPDTVLEINNQSFAACAGHNKRCKAELAEMNVKAAPGLALVNKSSVHFSAKVQGPGAVWPTAKTKLKPGAGSAFVFMKPGDYRISVDGPGKSVLSAVLHVTF